MQDLDPQAENPCSKLQLESLLNMREFGEKSIGLLSLERIKTIFKMTDGIANPIGQTTPKERHIGR